MPTPNKKLPFKTSPKKSPTVDVGREDIGIIEIPRYNDLTPAERIFIGSNMEGIPSLQEETIRVSQNIADKSGMGILDVYNALTVGDFAILQKYLSEFVALQKIQRESLPKERQIYATAIITNRINKDWTLDDTGNPDLIHPELVKEISEFAQKEQNGWDNPPEVSEEDLKKSSGEKEVTLLTGEKSTGE